MIDNKEQMTPVIIAGLDIDNPNFTFLMDELAELVKANNMEVVGRIEQRLDKRVAGTYFGTGKVEEIKHFAEEKDTGVLVVNAELTPTQIRNLEKLTGLRVLDRTELILEIFANRAQSRQAKLQVALARLQYELPRNHPSENSLDQQRGGGGGNTGGGGLRNRGSGETKLELNRRTIEKQISLIKAELKEVEKNDLVKSKERQNSTTPKVALVGYTNAGKSTTMNALLDYTSPDDDSKKVWVKDMLFATLDTSVRRINLQDKKSFLLSDTVGFVSELPHNLVEAFKATLQEARDSDLIVQVVDYSDENYRENMELTQKVLSDIGLSQIPMIIAFNKADLAGGTYPIVNGNEIVYSAKDENSIAELIKLISHNIYQDYEQVKLELPISEGKLIAYLRGNTKLISENYEDTHVLIETELNSVDQNKFAKYIIK